jgi:galactofuranose transport system substrate-binding protein
MRWMIAVALVALVGCSKQPEKAEQPSGGTAATTPAAEKKLVVGFSQVGAESAWRTAETRSIQGEAAHRGVELKFADAQGKQAQQIQALTSFIAQKVDAIVLAPVVETGWDSVLQQAKDANIPVILVDRGVKVSDDSLYTTLIASDFVEEGRMAAEWLAKKMDGKANIYELQGTTGSAPAIDRKKGFEEIIAKYPDMKIVKSQSGDFTRAKGKQVMEAFIKSDGKNIQAVYAHNDDMALGAIQALDEAGMNPGKDVTLISVDAVKAAFEAMVAGKLNATVECNPLMGPLVFDTIDRVRKGEKLPKFIQNKDQLFEQANAAQVIGTREY